MSDVTLAALEAAILAHLADSDGAEVLDDYLLVACGSQIEEPHHVGRTFWRPAPAYRLYGMALVANTDITSTLMTDE